MKMKWPQKEIHGLKVKIGLKKSWISMMKNKYKKTLAGRTEFAEGQIKKMEDRIESLKKYLHENK